MSGGEVETIVKEANSVPDIIRAKIHFAFNKNAQYFSKYNKHSNKEIHKLFVHYNNLFASMESFSIEEEYCEDCRDTVVKFWSFILFDIWEREII
jgi:hypothetical protein|tara:strand:+ start:22690 stop:22974 length:285 start_codon:yes stop_codon:yes gene_type:complete